MHRPSPSRFLVLPALALFSVSLSVSLASQDTPETPNPKTPQHERLASLVGTWRTETKMAAMPGVPGMEEASEMVGIEHAKLVCGGLWLKVDGDGMCAGQQCSGMWLLGYDPHARSYQCIAASSMDDAPCCVEAKYDEKTKTWHFHGDSPMGAFRSEFAMHGPDKSVETCYSKDKDGKETEFMRSVRTRVKSGMTAKNASSKSTADLTDITNKAGGSDEAPALPAPLAALHADCGTWEADFKMEMPGMPAMTSKCREVTAPVCGGKWTWSTFTGEMMGAPFEGHALTGFDSKNSKVVSFWLDSMNGAFMRTDGSYDAKEKVFTMSGTCYDEQGKRGPVASTAKVTGKDARQLRMVFGKGDEQSVMTIDYRRAGK